MILRIKPDGGGEDLVVEHHWEGELPRAGDVMELHCGETKRFVVKEVDWVFEDVPSTVHEEVPLRHAVVVVVPESEAARNGAAVVQMRPSLSDPLCECGHRQSVHTPTMCRGDASTCTCRSFRSAESTRVI